MLCRSPLLAWDFDSFLAGDVLSQQRDPPGPTCSELSRSLTQQQQSQEQQQHSNQHGLSQQRQHLTDDAESSLPALQDDHARVIGVQLVAAAEVFTTAQGSVAVGTGAVAAAEAAGPPGDEAVPGPGAPKRERGRRVGPRVARAAAAHPAGWVRPSQRVLPRTLMFYSSSYGKPGLPARSES